MMLLYWLIFFLVKCGVVIMKNYGVTAKLPMTKSQRLEAYTFAENLGLEL